MSGRIWLGVVLITVGIVALAYGGFSFFAFGDLQPTFPGRSLRFD